MLHQDMYGAPSASEVFLGQGAWQTEIGCFIIFFSQAIDPLGTDEAVVTVIQ
jgi:hypothetical protein